MSPNPEDQLKQTATSAVRRLVDAGFVAYWAGGCVRDMLIGKDPVDYDIATNALPDTVQNLFPQSMAIGKSFGVILAPLDNSFFEIATFRKDAGYDDGRHPTSVTFTDEETDAQRRDFTVNALFYDPLNNTIIDYVSGQADIKRKVIRCVGIPDNRFDEDGLRMLRAARFTSVLSFNIHPETADAIRRHSKDITRISAERIRQELTRILTESPDAGSAIELLGDLGLLEIVLPEVTAMKGQDQPPEFHPEGDVFRHTVLMLNMLTDPSPVLAFSTLLHDIGKPPTVDTSGPRLTFHRHAEEGAEMAEKVLKRLKFASGDIDKITYCIRNHMRFGDVTRMRRATLRKLIGAPTFDDELELHRVDCASSHGKLGNHQFLMDYLDQFEETPPLPAPWVSGHDIMGMGVPEGKEVGSWLKKAYNAQLDEQFSSPEDLREWIQGEIAESRRNG